MLTDTLRSALWKSPGLIAEQAFRPILHNGSIASTRKVDQTVALRPHLSDRRYGWTHYGVMIPDLPLPDRYFSVMVIAGMQGTRAFDIDEVVTTTARDTATVSVSTAADGAAFYRGYSMANDCALSEDGSDLRFGEQVRISGSFPSFTVDVTAPNVSAHLEFSCVDLATWFFKSPIYDHLSFLGTYAGWVETAGARREVTGNGNIEYARSAGPASLRRSMIPARWKFPLDVFMYHVIDLPDDGQLLFGRLGVNSHAVANGIRYRTLAGDENWSTDDDVFYEILEYADEPLVDAVGNKMAVPVRFKLGVIGRVTVYGTYDCPQRFGVGRGYIAGYEADVHLDGKIMNTRGYAEYVDVSEENTR